MGKFKKNISKKNLIPKEIVGVRKKRRKSIVPSILKKPLEDLTEEEIAERDKKMQDFLPRIDIEKHTTKINLARNAEECKKHTKDSCFRPDIYLDYGCSHCSLFENCACPIKKSKKRY